eukprot:Sdes_comp20270_c0_seq1m13812
MDYGQLLDSCAELLEGFSPIVITVDDHFERFVREKKITNENDRLFLHEVFSGSIRHKKPVDVLIQRFYNEDKSCMRVDRSLYFVVAYLALFRLDELGFPQFKKLVKSQDSEKMHKLLKFLFKKDTIENFLTHEWYGIYDKSFVDTKLRFPLLKRVPQIEPLISKLDDQRKSQMILEKSKQPPTKPEPFQLTRPRRRKAPEPQPIPTMGKARALPPTTYAPSGDRELIERAKQANRRRQQRKYEAYSQNIFSCALRPRKTHVENDAQNNAPPELPVFRSSWRPPKNVPETAIRINTTTILREDALLKGRVKKEIQKLRDLSSGHLDESEFEKWKEREALEAKARELATKAERHLQAQISHEEAILSKRNQEKFNLKAARNLRKQREDLLKKHADEINDLHEENRRIVQITKESEDRAKFAVQKIQSEKQKIANQVNEQAKEYSKIKFLEAQADRERKAELIRQIKAMEKTPQTSLKLVDMTHTSDCGLLSEMSIMELRERLSQLKVRRKEEEYEKRRSIVGWKQKREENLMRKLEAIEYFRCVEEQKVKDSAAEKEQKKKDALIHQSKHLESNSLLLTLKEKLESRKQKRIEQVQRSKLQRFPKATSVQPREEVHWENVEKTVERGANLRAPLVQFTVSISEGETLHKNEFKKLKSPLLFA